MTIKALQSVCYHCSRLLCADPNNLEFKQAILIENPQNRKKEEQESKS